jgi:hypothetical protein
VSARQFGYEPNACIPALLGARCGVKGSPRAPWMRTRQATSWTGWASSGVGPSSAHLVHVGTTNTEERVKGPWRKPMEAYGIRAVRKLDEPDGALSVA